MTISERCRSCHTEMPPQWLEPIYCGGKQLAGTGVWRNQSEGGLCPKCVIALDERIAQRQRRLEMYLRLVQLGGGEKPYREFRFETFNTEPQNAEAFGLARAFNPDRDNLYLWGACGVGKTHLAFAIAKAACEVGRSVEFLKPPQLLRRVRMRDPDEEQRAIDQIARADLFVLDDLGIGNDTLFARQVFQEILDARMFAYRAGLVVTSKYSLGALAAKLDDDTITSRLAGLARIVHLGGEDHRLKSTVSTDASGNRDFGLELKC